ncbi:MAG: hypothetical protein E6H67_02675 [Betaproteobacteria bacterium]|nr:MAG: hypothetical protein E6H67_02675 [Betaproteobacteria bacterium]
MAVWQIQLLGGLRATHGNCVIAQFPSRPIAMLLARLALQPQRRHAREELIELLWPNVELDVGRNRLRQVLSTLRRLLEPATCASSSNSFGKEPVRRRWTAIAAICCPASLTSGSKTNAPA